MDVLTQIGLAEFDVLNIGAIVVALLLILGLLRGLFRLTRSVLRMGCAIIVLIAGILILMAFLGGASP